MKECGEAASIDAIQVRGAREHNLKDIDVDVPRGRLVVVTGLSGSGKSSLAFDTIYAEGQRRYVESLSAYARQFLETMRKPDVDSIDGLSPAISIEQKTTSKNPRSTVGTVTEIHDHMRLLWARAGTPHSPATGLPIEARAVSSMVDEILRLPVGSKIAVLAPVVRSKKGTHRKEIEAAASQGFQRVRLDGEVFEIEDAPDLDKNKRHDVEIVVDRIVVADDQSQRLAEAVERAAALADGLVLVVPMDAGKPKDAEGGMKAKPSADEMLFSTKFACPVSGFSLPELEPRLFSFNSPHGACPDCDGLGVKLYMDPDLVVPDPSLSISEGAVEGWSIGAIGSWYASQLGALCRKAGVSAKTPWKDLPEPFRRLVLDGAPGFEGVLANMWRRWKETDSSWMREELSRYQSSRTCPTCSGRRLRPEALCVKIAGKDVSEVSELPVARASEWFEGLEGSLVGPKAEIASRILKEIRARLGFLVDVGLGYLTLARSAATLSGGEGQRIRLASQIGSGLTGVVYVLDEPSIGLHQRDNAQLLKTLLRLRDLGNTVIVVEHDEDAMRASDHLIDMGPGAGVHGGRIVAQGTPAEVEAAEGSVTADYLSGRSRIPVPSARRKGNGLSIEVRGARGNNLKKVDASFPLGRFVCVTGVSGSGKSTLVLDTLHVAAAKAINGSRVVPAPHDGVEGLSNIDKIVEIDQSPIGRTPRSNPATYAGAFGPIRDWFASLPESKARGYKPGRFSFNVKGGRCEACQGEGFVRVEMHFLPDVFVGCEVCSGARYNRETLEVQWKGRSIADVLSMTIEDALGLFSAVPAIASKMKALDRVGLGYVQVGQAATTLSGGEAQRVKLAKELSKRSTGRTLYILDEPTTGLHFEDVRRLLELLHELVDQGNTVVVIEHDLEVVKTADWVIDLGPEGGGGGGRIVAAGTPEAISASKAGHTGAWLRKVLDRSGGGMPAPSDPSPSEFSPSAGSKRRRKQKETK